MFPEPLARAQPMPVREAESVPNFPRLTEESF